MLLGHHGVDPAGAVGGDDGDGALEVAGLEALAAVDLAHLLALAFRHQVEVALLHGAQAGILVDLGAGAAEVGGGHREPVAHQVGHAHDQDDTGREVGPHGTCHHGQGGDRTVDAAIDEIAQVADVGAGGEPAPDRGAVVEMLEPAHGGVRAGCGPGACSGSR